MRSIVASLALALALGGAASAWAGGSCCAAGKGKQAAMKGCSDSFASLDLSAEQQAKIAEIEKACAAEGSGKEACEKYKGEIKKLLTADQLKAWEAACQSAEGGTAKAGS